MAKERIGSILLADCGTTMTKAVLLDQVGEQYRFVARGEAPTTTEHPWLDITAGIRHAAEEISAVTGRQLFDGSGSLISPELNDHEGVDAFAATVSASKPLQVTLGGLVRDLSVASAERAAAGTYSQVQGIITSEDQGVLREEHLVHMIHEAAPEVICVAGGIEGGATTPVLQLVDTVALACSLMTPETRPQMLYAGNSRLRERVVKIVEGRAELRVSDNVRPALEEEDLTGAQEELDALYLDKIDYLPGIDIVAAWSSAPITPTARAFGLLVEYLWHLGDETKGVVGVDLGAANTTVAAVFNGRLSLSVRSSVGIAFGGDKLLQERGPEAFSRWLPKPMSAGEIRSLLINKERYPTSIPQEPGELWLEQALAREAIRKTLEIARPGWRPGAAQRRTGLTPLCDTIVVSGGVLAGAPRPSQAALVILDALEPIGITTLVLDRYGLTPLLGTAAAIKPLAAVETLDNGGLTNLATVIAPFAGHARHGDVILRVRMQYDDGSTLTAEVRYGELEVLPLPPGQQAKIVLEPKHGFDAGLGGGRRGQERQVSGGLAGLIIDARGRPLRFQGSTDKQHAQMQRWLWNVGG